MLQRHQIQIVKDILTLGASAIIRPLRLGVIAIVLWGTVAEVAAQDVSGTNKLANTSTTRILNFSQNQGEGRLSAKDPWAGQDVASAIGLNPELLNLSHADWDFMGMAQGHITVREDQRIKLQINLRSQQDILTGLSELGPSDLYELSIQSWTRRRSSNQVSLEAMSHLTGLQSLTLCQTGINGKQLSCLKAFPLLRALSMSEEYAFRNDDMVVLKDLSALEYLDCGTGITDKGLEYLGQLSNLRWLRLRMEKIRGPGLAHLANLARLERLSLWGERISDRHVGFLQGLRHLKSLTLWGSNVPFGDTTLTAISKLTTLEELYFIRVQTNFSTQGLAQLASLKHLRKLNLGQGWGAGVAECLTVLPQLESIKPVALTTDNMKALSHLPHLTSLGISLLPSSRESTSQAITHLAALKTLEKLTICRVSGRAQYWSDQDLAQLARLSRLKHWSASRLDITDQGWASIGKLTSLEFLSIRLEGEGTKSCVTKHGLNHLNELANLKTLYVDIHSQSPPVTDNTRLDFAGLHHLQVLSLIGFPLQETDLAWLASLNNLEELTLYNRLSENALTHLEGLSKLENLYLSGITCTDGHGLASLSGLNQLKRLTLRGKITDSALSKLPGFPLLWAFDVTTDETIYPETIARLRQILPADWTVDIEQPQQEKRAVTRTRRAPTQRSRRITR